MLRRKLLTILLVYTGLLMALAMIVLVSLQGIFGDLNYITTHANALADDATEMGSLVASIEAELHELDADRKRHLDDLLVHGEQLREIASRVGEHPAMREAPLTPLQEQVQDRLATFEEQIGTLATVQDPQLTERHSVALLRTTASLRADIGAIAREAQRYVHDEQMTLTDRFRWLVLGLAVAFLLVINTSILLLLRSASMILRPIDRLIEASRQLANERFDHRVEVERADEFGELAEAFNRLGQRLEENEQRKIEMIKQVAVTLNHELNNANAIIEMQLALMKRQSGGNTAVEKALHQIHENTQHMAEVVDALNHVRQIVLTDYVAGTKMLDLERSVRALDGAPAEPDSVESTRSVT